MSIMGVKDYCGKEYELVSMEAVGRGNLIRWSYLCYKSLYGTLCFVKLLSNGIIDVIIEKIANS